MNQPSNDDHFHDDLNQLLAEARTGSTDARNQLFAQVHRYLTFLAAQNHNDRLSAKAGASDIVQQTLLHAAKDFDQFQGTTAAQFRGWLRQILVNEVRTLNRQFNTLRRNSAQEIELAAGKSSSWIQHEPSNGELTPSRQMIDAEHSELLIAAMERLPEEMKQVIELRNWEKLSFDEIATRMARPVSSTAKLWYRALIELQKAYSTQESNG